MDLDRAFRKLIEEKGIKILSSRSAYHYLSDLCPKDIYKYRFLFKLQEFPSLYHDLLLTKGIEDDIKDLSHNFSIKTGFRNELIRELLEIITNGVRMAFYGTYPSNKNSLTLISLYEANKKEWNKRLELLKDGAFYSEIDGKITWILSSGEEILPRKFYSATNFSEGLACIRKDNQLGLINIRGNLEVDLNEIDDRGGYIKTIEHGLALRIKDYPNINHIINKDGIILKCCFEEVSQPLYTPNTILIIKQNNLLGIINNRSQLLINPTFKSISKFKGDKAIGEYPNGKYAILYSSGKLININSEYEDIEITNERSLMIGYPNPKLRKKIRKGIMFINELGKEMQIPIKIKRIVDSTSIPFLIREEETDFYYFIDNEGILYNNYGYEKAFPFRNNLYTWVKQGNFWILINKLGKPIYCTDQYDIISEYNEKGNLCRNKINGNLFIIDIKKNDPIINEVENSSLIAVKSLVGNNLNKIIYSFNVNGTTWKFIDGVLYNLPFEEGEVIASVNIFNNDRKLNLGKDNEFEDLYEVTTGYPIIISKPHNNTYLIYNILTKETSKIKLNKDEKIRDGLIRNNNSYLIVEGKDYQYFINLRNGNKSENASFIDYFDTSKEEFIIHKDNEVCYLLDKDFNKISNGYDNIENCHEDIYIVSSIVKINGKSKYKYGLINNKGKEILPLEYDNLSFTHSKNFLLKNTNYEV